MSILAYIAAQPNGLCSLSQLYAAFPCERVDSTLLKLYAIGYIVPDGQAYRITSVGLDALALSQRHIEERAEQERREKEQAAQCKKDKKQQFRHDFLVAAFGAAVGSIITGIIDHHDELIMLIKELFGK